MSRLTSRLHGIRLEFAAAAAIVFASGSAAILQGQDANIDLYRYRLYIGYAFLHGRLDQDLAPAALSTYLNPILEAFHYLGIAHLPPRMFSFLLGGLQGLNAVLVMLLARLLLLAGPSSRLLCLLAGLLAASGPTARSLLGTTFGDTTVSLPALAALLVALRACADPNEEKRRAAMLWAGLFAGVALGLKLTMASGLIALGVLVAWGLARRWIGIGAGLAALAGASVGYLAIAGYWGWQLWQRFRNPIFPFANQVFRSPYLPAEAVRDSRWAASGVLDYLSPLVDMALGMTARLQEIPFRDARWLLLALSALAWVGLRLARRRPPLPPAQQCLLLYVLVSYVVWGRAFYYYRYAAVLEFLAPLALILLIQAAFPRFARHVAVTATILLMLTSSVGSWGRLAWGERWFDIRLPPQAQELDSLVLLDSPLSSFLIPYFPRQTHFAGLEGTGSARLDDLVTARIAAHKGSLFWLVSRGRPAPSTSPESFGLAVTDDCGLIRTGEGRWALCRVARTPGPRT